MKLTYPTHPTPLQIACVASVSAQVWRESWDDSKEKEWQGRRRGEKETAFPPFPSPFPFLFVIFAPALTFAHWLNWKRLLHRLRYQHWNPPVLWACTVHWRVAEEGWAGDYSLAKTKYLVASTLWAQVFSRSTLALLSRTSQRVIDIFIFSSQEDLFAKSTFFPSSIFIQKCGTDPVAHHRYPPKEVLPWKENPSWKG